MAKKRRPTEVFSLSFLDCICCGFGAMLLLFVLTIGRHSSMQESVTTDLQSIISKLQKDISVAREEQGVVANRLQFTQRKISEQVDRRDDKKKNISKLKDELALLMQQRSSLKDQLEKLLAEEKDVPKQEEPAPIPIPNVGRRQYLTGVNFEGNYMLIMVEMAGSMTGDSIDEAIEMISRPEEERRKSVKWRRIVRSVQWIIANLSPKQAYQVLVYSTDARPLIEGTENQWFDPMDRPRTAEVLKALENITPTGGANMERAFTKSKEMFASLETIILLTDGLPTQGDSVQAPGTTTDEDRERLWRAAHKAIPRRVPVNTILFPMTGDPAAPYLFWQLAEESSGSLVCPAATWPDI